MSRLTDIARGTEASALVEFAITVPLLVVFIVGIYDFSAAYNQEQKLEHAAQTGAVIAAAQPRTDIYNGNASPDSLKPVVEVVFNSLATNNVLPLANQSPCAAASSSVTPTGLVWTYQISGCPDQLTIVINSAAVQAGPPATVGTSVTVTYPYRWRFNSAIQLLFPANYSAITDLTETATVHNQL